MCLDIHLLFIFVSNLYDMKYDIKNDQKLEDYFKAVRMRLEGASREEVIENTDFPSWRVLEFFMTQNDLTLPSNKASYNKQVDVTFFDSIDSCDKAYILGFIYADGCIYDKGRFGFCLAEKDEEILNFIKEKMKSTSNITKVHNTKGSKNRQPQALLRISSVKLVDVLKDVYGINVNKTLNEGLVFPNFEENLLLSFIRGLSDGDGNIYFVKGKNDTTANSKFRWTLCMTDKHFLLKLKNYLHEKGITVAFYEKQGKTCKYYVISTNSREHTRLFCKLLYSTEGFYLQRKKDKYLEYIKLLDNTVLNTEINKSVSV